MGACRAFANGRRPLPEAPDGPLRLPATWPIGVAVSSWPASRMPRPAHPTRPCASGCSPCCTTSHPASVPGSPARSAAWCRLAVQRGARGAARDGRPRARGGPADPGAGPWWPPDSPRRQPRSVAGI